MSNSYKTLEDWLIKARAATLTTNPNAPELIAGKVLKLNRAATALKSSEIILTQKKLMKLNNLLGKLLKGRPLASVLHYTEFHNVSLKINSRVLSPRAETEDLVEYASKNIPKNSVVFDIGTGSGSIGLALAKSRPDLHITVTDLLNSTLRLARLNARKNKINGVGYLKSNLIKNIDQSTLKDAFFLANLPYVNPAWRELNHKNLKHEPRSALFAGRNGLQMIENLLGQITKRDLLSKNNWILIEHDPKQLEELKIYAKRLNLDIKKITEFVSLLKAD